MTNDTASAMDMHASRMEGGVVPTDHAREAILIHDDELPHVNLPDGSTLQLLQVDLTQNLWVVRNHFKPGFQIDTHYHPGPVFAVTQSGEWFYKEYPDKVNRAGSYLYEPAHSVHTLTVAEDATEDAVVWFAIVVSGVLFGLVHAPSYLAAGCRKSPMFFTAVISLNLGASLIFGWLYWQVGLEAAMIGHMLFHLVWWPFDAVLYRARPEQDGLELSEGMS